MRIWKLVFALWVFFWLFFMARGLYKGELDSYRTLLPMGPEEKRAHVVGGELYDFLKFCLEEIPEGATFRLHGAFRPIDERRFAYYLYPRVASEYPEYLICYKMDNSFIEKGYRWHASLKWGHFILKKKGA